MRATALLVASVLAVAGLTGCGDTDAEATMPKLTGKKLDVAYELLAKAGVKDQDKVKVDGGGAFGVVVESNWTVCEQSPAAGETLPAAAKLTIDRSCDDASAEGSEAPSNSPSAEPTAVPTLTASNSPEFAAVLKAGDSCDANVARFAADHIGAPIQFDGSIAAISPHDESGTQLDILVGPGDAGANVTRGPSFQFSDKKAIDLRIPAEGPDTLEVGQKYRFVATVANYDDDSCLFQLDPGTTIPR